MNRYTSIRRIVLLVLLIGNAGFVTADETESARPRAVAPWKNAATRSNPDAIKQIAYLDHAPSATFGNNASCGDNGSVDRDIGKIDFTRYATAASSLATCDPQRSCFNKWYAQTDLIFLSREDEPYAIGATTIGANAQPVELNHGFTPGVRATLGIRTGTTGHFQISYLGINDWSADNRTANIPFGAGTLRTIDQYTANLNDLQFNLVAMDPYADWDWLCGLRVIDQRDEFGSLATVDNGAGGFSERIDAAAANTLFGVQVGARYGRRFGPISFDGGVKAGVFNNFVSQSGILENPVTIDGNPSPTFDVDDDEVSFMGDFQASMTYHATTNASLRLGYQGLIFSEIAQSTLQDGGPSSPTGLAYHGVFVGLEWRR